MSTFYVVLAWFFIVCMFAWATYLYFHWSAAAALPMQWGITGRPTWYAARGPALFLWPVISALLLAFVTFAKRGPVSTTGLMITSSSMLLVQALWVFLARRYV
jgi:uncharacterized membrane protein